MLINMGCSTDIAEDIVQSMYLKIHRIVESGTDIMYNDEEVNRFYIYLTLRSMFIDYQKAKNKYTFFEYMENDTEYDVYENHIEDDVDYEMEHSFDLLTRRIREEINSWDDYHTKLANLYLRSDYSLRDIAELSDISLTSIFNSIKNYKAILKDKFGEDWEDFINGDYNHLK